MDVVQPKRLIGCFFLYVKPGLVAGGLVSYCNRDSVAGVFIVGAIREEIISRGVFTSTADVRLLFHSKTRDTTLDRDMPANPRSPCIKTPVIPSATPDRDTLANPSPPAYCMPIVPDWGPLKGRESALVRPPVPDELSRGGCRPGAVRGLRLCTCGVDFYGRNGKKKR